MSEGLEFVINADGVATLYDDTYDITIHCESQEEQDEVLKRMKSQPVASTEIVRCRDCKFYRPSHWYCEAWNNSPGFPAVSDEMFCSMAERRDDV